MINISYCPLYDTNICNTHKWVNICGIIVFKVQMIKGTECLQNNFRGKSLRKIEEYCLVHVKRLGKTME